jgi:hypothetical protein
MNYFIVNTIIQKDFDDRVTVTRTKMPTVGKTNTGMKKHNAARE